MSLKSTYVYECDAINCAIQSAPQENNYYNPPGWSSLSVRKDGKRNLEDRTLHFCPKCTGGILDGFLNLHEEEN
jgi:hypothetical protein